MKRKCDGGAIAHIRMDVKTDLILIKNDTRYGQTDSAAAAVSNVATSVESPANFFDFLWGDANSTIDNIELDDVFFWS